jgi:hypothetical protein
MHEPTFDPYHKWLGIPPKDQPPDHYRLLGLERFEADPDVIAHAADARMTHIKTLATGAFGHLSQVLLNAISAARVCLLNPVTKAEYDAALRKWIDEQQLASATTVPPPLPPKSQGSLVPVPMLIAVGVGTCLLLLIIVAATLLFRPAREVPVAVAHNPATASPKEPLVSEERKTQSSAATAAEPSETTGPVATKKPTPPTSESKAKNKAKAAENNSPVVGADPKPQPAKPEASEPPAETPPASPAAMEPDISAPMTPSPTSPDDDDAAKPSEPVMDASAPSQPKSPPTPPAVPEAELLSSSKRPVPSSDEQAKLQKQVDDIYKPAEATTSQKKLELAEKMFATAEETKDDPVSRYVLMQSAWRLAGEAGKLDLALDMIDRAKEWYVIEPLAAKIAVLERAENAVGTGPETEAFSLQLVRKAEMLVDLALGDDDFPTAMHLLEKIAIPAARRTSDKQLAVELAKRRLQIRRQREDFAGVEKAQEALAANKADAEANLTLGRWHCLVKGDWERGLPYLAKGSDQALAGLAQRELAGATSSQAQIELADAWWDLSEQDGSKQKDPIVASMRARAGFWYQKALPFLTGLHREKAEKRLGDITATTEPHNEYALEFDGWKSHAIVDFGYPGTYPITIEAIVQPAIPPNPNMGTVISNFDRSAASGLMLTCQSRLWGFCFVEMQRTTRNTPPPGSQQRLHARVASQEKQWHHVAGVFDGKQLRLYVDGQLQESRAVSGIHKPTTKLPFVIGACPALGPSGVLLDDYFKGLIKAVRISSVSRYTDSFTPPTQLLREDANTQLLLIFNKGSGDVVVDASGRRGSSVGTGGRKRSGPVTAKLIGTKWVSLDAPAGEAKAPASR